MTLLDKNKTLQEPVGYDVHSVVADGAYLRIEYHLSTYNPAQYGIIVVYLNDQGREVARCLIEPKAPKAEPEIVAPISRWSRFCTGWYLILTGLQEMIQCRKKS